MKTVSRSKNESPESYKSRNKNTMIQHVLCAEVGVLHVWKAEVSVDNIKLIVGGKAKRKNDSIWGLWSRFQTRKRRHVSDSDLWRQQQLFNKSDMCERKVPTTCSTAFLVGFIKDIGFRRIILKCDHKPSTKALQRVDSKHLREWMFFHKEHLRVITWPMVVWKWFSEKWNDNAELSWFQLNKTQARDGDDSPPLSWLQRLQRKSWRKWYLVKMEKRAEWDELVEAWESQWHIFERKFGSVK